jgi:uncharacterized membrane protein YhiD involved in acid resistance
MKSAIDAVELALSRASIAQHSRKAASFIVLACVLISWLPIQDSVCAQSAQVSAPPVASAAQQQPPPSEPAANPFAANQNGGQRRPSGDAEATPDGRTQLQSLRHALVRLPIAAGLSAILAFRPRRRGTPARQSPVIQTQIILAIVGAIVMLVVGASLARAFGIVGAAGLIRYRAKIEDPKDAGVMLSTLALGLASGVGLYLLAVFATVFVLGVLWVVESIEPEPQTVFDLKITMKDPANAKPAVEGVLRRFRVPFDLRSSSAEEVSYEVKVPVNRRTETISEAIAALDSKQAIEVTWEKKKEKS